MSDISDLTPAEMRCGIALQLREIEHLRAERDELREQLTLAESVRASQVAGLVDGAERLRENGQRLLAVSDSAVQHQHDMIEAACAPLLESMASERHRAFLLAERVRVLEGALHGCGKTV